MGRKPSALPASPRKVTPRKPQLTRYYPCGTCEGCKQKNCGKCIKCKSMVCFGGTGRRKERCETRVCTDPVKRVAKSPSLSTHVGKASPSSTKSSPKSVGKTSKEGKNELIVTPRSSNKLKEGSSSKTEKMSSKKVNDSKGSGILLKGSGTPLTETQKAHLTSPKRSEAPSKGSVSQNKSGISPKRSGKFAKDPWNSPKMSVKSSKDPGTSLKKSVKSFRDPRTSPKRSLKSPKDSGTSPKRSGTSPKRSGTSPKRSGTSPKRTGTSPKRSGTSPKRSGTSPKVSETPSCKKKVETRDSSTSKTNIIDKKEDLGVGTKARVRTAVGKFAKSLPDKDTGSKPATVVHTKSMPTMVSLLSSSPRVNNSPSKTASIGTMTPISKKTLKQNLLEVTSPDKRIHGLIATTPTKPVHMLATSPNKPVLLAATSPTKHVQLTATAPTKHVQLTATSPNKRVQQAATSPNKHIIQLVATTPTKPVQPAATKRSKLTSPEKASQPSDVTCLPGDTLTMPHKKDIQLPRVKLDSMTKSELKEFIPRLLKLVTGRDEVFYSRRSARPEWWPDDVPWANSRAAWHTEKYWTDNLRSVVKNCYQYVGKEELIQSFVVPEETQYKGLYPPSPMKMRMFPQDLFLPFSAEIYICFFCEKEFLSKDKMRSHQKGCIERPPNLQSVSTVPPSEHNVNQGPPCMSPKRPIAQKWSNLTKTAYTENIGLVPKHTAAKLREQRPSLEEINCEILDEVEPMSPVTPKTPKSLISQLSREDSGHGSRKRLSYSMSLDKPDKDKVDIIVESDSDSETETGAVKKPIQEMNLLDIPISSLLGQRVKKNIHVDAPLCIVEDTGSFCRTPVKNSFLEKLRKKPMAYPVLYRPRRIANLHKQNHVYRFKKSEVKEFMCRATTGLNSKSLEKFKSMKKFSIRLRRLSRKRLLEWIPRRRLDRQLMGKFKGLKYRFDARYDDMECVFPSGPTLLAKNIDKLLGLKVRNSQTTKPKLNHSLSLSNCISEEMEAEVSKQKLTLYRSLLYEMSVLKPAVVIEDVGKSDNVSNNNNTSDTTNCKTPSLDNDEEEKSDYPNLRTILLRPNLPTMPSIVSSTPVSLYIPEKKETKQSKDCSVSVISGSSDSESLPSTCCQACSEKHGSPFYPSPNGGKRCVCEQGVQGDESMHEPLHVQVHMPVGSKTDDYGIPSPVSVSSESPFPPYVFKADSTPRGKLIDLSPSSSTGRETRHSRSAQSPIKHEKPTADDKISKLINVDSARVPRKYKKQKYGRSTMFTRSSSVTPSGSPIKRMGTGFSSSSLPSSPRKSVKPTLPLDVKRVCKKLKKSSSDSVKVKGNVSSTNTAMSPKSGSPVKRVIQLNRASSSPASLSRKHMLDRSTPPDSPARARKRKSSLPMDKALPSKLRKISSDI